MAGYTLGAEAIRQIQEVVRAYMMRQPGIPLLPSYGGRDRGPWLAKADSYVARNSDGQFSIFHGPTMGSETDVGRTITARCRMSGIPSGAWAYIWIIDGKMEAVKVPMLLLGKADAAISQGSSGTVSLHAGSGGAGSETDTSENLTVYNRQCDVSAGQWVYAFPGESSWEI